MNRTVALLLCPPLFAVSLIVVADTGPSIEQAIELYEAKEYDEAIELFERIAETGPDREKAVFLAGRACFDKEAFREASRWFEKSLEIDGENAEYHTWLGRAYGSWALNASMFRKMSLADDIRRSFQKAVELDPDNLERRNDLITFYLEAPGVVGGSKDKALAQAGAIAKLNPVQGEYAFGRVYEKQKDFEKAEAAYRKAIEMEPDASSSYYRLAYLLQRREEFGRAHEVLAAWVESDPGDLGAYYQLGRNGSLSGQHLESAAEALEHYISNYRSDPSQPSLAWAYTRLGQIRALEDDPAAARVAFREALRLDPGHKQASKGLKSVD